MTFSELQKDASADWDQFIDPSRARILIGTGTCGLAAGAGEILEVIRKYLSDNAIDATICEVGCLGLCYAEPLVELSREGAPRVLYGDLTMDNIEQCLDGYFKSDSPGVTNAVAVIEGEPPKGIPAFAELPIMKGQVRIASRNCGVTDPESINHYIARGGYAGLERALQMEASEVINEVKAAGLRGRGGAGFPTALKWEFCSKAAGDDKYMICNADEGDPGAFMDRSVIESDPHSIVEGMLIAAYAIGAAHGYVYVRAEYPLAIERLQKAIAQATEAGLIGENVLGSDFSFELKIKKGAGAFVCGEETALIASIEGRRGMPRSRPPFPANKGLFGKPSNINNVETLANIPFILGKGSAAFAANGTEKSRGTKTFALTGKILRTGLIEVPLGISLRQIIFDIGGGIDGDGEFKAVQTGGPSGGCIPAELLELPVDYEKLAEAGAIMGSGGMVVMDEATCMVDLARYFVEFTKDESCGKCAPCRLGTQHMLGILKAVCAGEATQKDLAMLDEVAHAVNQGSLCGLGQTAPNPVLTTLRYFRDEYDAHVDSKHCPAGQCSKLARYEIIADKCTGCHACVKKCPTDAIEGEVKAPHVIDQQKCIRCGACFDVCKFDAILKE